jgi:hypothetical protein
MKHLNDERAADLFASLSESAGDQAPESSQEAKPEPTAYLMREPCRDCGCAAGVRRMNGQQDTVRCRDCGRFCYNAPRTETGMKPRTVRTTHEAIKPAQRARIILRANGACEACHKVAPLHVGHWVSVADGHARGMSDTEINSDENLLALCEECNLGLGRETVPLRLVIAAVVARAKGHAR